MPKLTADYPEFIGVKVPRELADAVRERAAREGRSISDIARRALREATSPLVDRPIRAPQTQ